MIYFSSIVQDLNQFYIFRFSFLKILGRFLCCFAICSIVLIIN